MKLTCNQTAIIRLSGTIVLSALAGYPAASLAQTPEDGEYLELDAFTVTGSRIFRLDVEPVAPVDVMSAQDIRNTGFNTVGDVLRALPYNSGTSLVPADSGTSFTPGVSTMNLRGLGNNQTLFLINGRRAAPFAAPGFDGLQTVFDLNSIPVAAIETIEIQKDGASAIYGSDAVGGVVNVRLREDFQGLTTSLRFGDYFDAGGMVKEFSAVAGSSEGRLSIVTVFNWYEQNSVYARDLDYTKSADKTDEAWRASPHYIEYDADDEEIGRIEGSPVDDGWFNLRSVWGAPGFVWPDSSDLPYYRSPEAGMLDRYASEADLEPYFLDPYWDYQTYNGLFPEVRRYSFYTSAEYDFSATLRGYVELSFSRSESEVESAPTLISNTENGLYPGTPMVMPGVISWEDVDGEGNPVTLTADNPSNPFDEDITFMGRRLYEAGNRIRDMESDTPRIVLGLRGEMEPFGLGAWLWDAYALYTKNTVNNVGRNDIADYRMQQALYGLVPIEGGGGYEWNDRAPAGERVFFNFWGENDPAMIDYLTIENPTSAEYEMWVYEASVTGNLFELPAGMVGVALGAEHRSEELTDTQTDLNATGMLLGGGESRSSHGERDVTAIYVEFGVPVTEQLELQLAARWEDYSDRGIEKDTRPKVGFRYRPLDWLVFKGSYSESFKAPDLAYLYNSGIVTYTSGQYLDPVTGDQRAIQTRTGGNPNLAPETADIYYLGVEIEPAFVPGLSLSMSWFHIDQVDLLALVSDVYDYGEILVGAAAGDELFRDMVVRDPANNHLLYLLDNFANLSKAEQTSWDFSAQYTWLTDDYGRFNVYWNTTWLEDYSSQPTPDEDWEEYSSYNLPEWRHNAGISWRRGDWSATLFASYIGEREREMYDAATVGPDGIAGTDDDGSVYMHYTVKQQVILNTSVSYAGLWNTAVTVGVNNLLNRDPPLDPMDPTGSTSGVNDLEPSFWWVRLEKDW